MERQQREHTINRVVIKSPEGRHLEEGERQEAAQAEQERLKRLYEEGGIIRGREVEKSPEDREAIAVVFPAIEAFVRRYGGEPVPLDGDVVRIVERTEKLPPGRDFGAEYSPHSQRLDIIRRPGRSDESISAWRRALRKVNIFRRPDVTMSAATKIMRIAHEAMHANSFNSLEVTPAEDGAEPVIKKRHVGFALGDRDGKMVGHWLNEGMTQALAYRFTNEVGAGQDWLERHNAKARQHAESTGFLRPQDISGIFEKDGKVSAELSSYASDMRKLDDLIDDLTQRLPDQFADREAAFDLFARAFFTGNLLPLGRALDEAYGPSALRRVLDGQDVIATAAPLASQRLAA